MFAENHNNTNVSGEEFRPAAAIPNVAQPVVTSAKNGKAKVRLTWEGEGAGVRYTVMVDGKKVYSGTKTSCTVSLKDGEHRYYVMAQDKEGNVTQSAEGRFSFDATAPIVTLQTPTVSYEAEGAGKGTVTLAATSNDEGATYKVTLTKDGKALEGVYGLALGELADGNYKYTLIAVDAAGNESKKQTGSFLVDSSDVTAPGAPVLKGDVKCSRKGEDKSNVRLSWTAPLDPTDPKGKKKEKVASYQISCYDEEGNLVLSTFSKGTSYTFKGLQDGNYNFHISAYDKAGNGGEALQVKAVAVDTVAPEVTGLAHEVQYAEQGSALPDVSLSWEGGEEAAASYIVKLGGKTYTFKYDDASGKYLATTKVGKETVTLSLEQAADGTFTYNHTASLRNGKYKYSITAVDAAGNKKEYKGETVVATPKLQLKRTVTSKVEEGVIRVTLNWTGDRGQTYTIKVDGEELLNEDGSIFTTTGTSHTFEMKDGMHSYSITALNNAGGVTTLASAFERDATTSELVVHEPVFSEDPENKDVVKVSLSWLSEEPVNDPETEYIVYSLSYMNSEGEEVVEYYGSETSYDLHIPHGETVDLVLTATDVWGNTATREFSVTGVPAGGEMQPQKSAPAPGLALDYQLQLSAGVHGMPATGLADACCASGLELLGAEKADKPETSLLA